MFEFSIHLHLETQWKEYFPFGMFVPRKYVKSADLRLYGHCDMCAHSAQESSYHGGSSTDEVSSYHGGSSTDEVSSYHGGSSTDEVICICVIQ